ncbi:MAG: transcription termination factor Rho [Lachnospiraceae bacterium]|nr:transcription termination factor Rho [Lachnospiraceae bacterium]
MREKYESLSLAVLRDLAKARNMKHISSMRKAELVEAMIAQDEIDRQNEEAAKAAAKETAESADDETRSGSDRGRSRQSSNARRVSPGQNQNQSQGQNQGQNQNRNQADSGRRQAQNPEGRRQPAPDARRNQGSQARRMQSPEGARPSGSQAEPQRAVRNDRQQDDRRQYGRPEEQQSDRRQYSRPEEQQSDRRQNSRVEEQQVDRRQYGRPEEQQAERGPSEAPQYERPPMELSALDSGNRVSGILEVLAEGYGFLRSDNYMPGENDIYVAPSQIRKFGLKTGDFVSGNTRVRAQQEKFSALLFVQAVNGMPPEQAAHRRSFEDMTPIFPDHRIRMERGGREIAMRIVDLISPIGRGQRGMIVSPPKAGKTTLLKDIARSILVNDPTMHIMIMLIDERPEEVTDIREAIVGERVEVLASTFDEQPEHHIKVAEMGIARAKRLVEYGENVTILLDSITRLARASNVTIQPSGRTLSGGLDPSSLNMPKRFFGAARNMREGGSLTILATALVDTGSKMDDVVYEEFKGTGNMELVLDRKLSERRVFPAIDIQKSGTRREDLLLDRAEAEAVYVMRRALNGMKGEEAVENILNMFVNSRDNAELIERVRRQRFI